MQAELENLVVNNMQITIDISNNAQMLVLCFALLFYTLLVWWGADGIDDSSAFVPGCFLVLPIVTTGVAVLAYAVRLVLENL